MKKVILMISVIIMFNGCAGQEPTPAPSGNPAFDLGQQIGKAIGDTLWGGK